MDLTLYSTPGAFLQDNRAFLEEHEASAQLNLGNAAANRDEPCTPELLFGRYGQDGQPLLLFGHAAPWNLCLNAPAGMEALPARAAEELAGYLKAQAVPIAGVTARESLCQAFMKRYGGRFTQRSAMDIMVLENVIQPPAVPGTVRPAEEKDLETLTEWACAFYREALHEEGDLEAIRQRGRERVKNRQTRVLESPDGQLLSTAHTSRETRRGTAISGVYTPPEHRGRGYCQFTVASLCREMLAQGKSYCTLFVDRKNPISNRVYQKIGFRVLEDCGDYRRTSP